MKQTNVKQTYVKPSIVANGDVVRETRNSEGGEFKPDWPYPEGEVYKFSKD